MKLVSLASAAAFALTVPLIPPAFATDTPATPAVTTAVATVINEQKSEPSEPAKASSPAAEAAAAATAVTAPAETTDAKPSAKLDDGKPAEPADAKPAEAKPAVVEKPAPPPITLRAEVDLTHQRLTVTENGVVKHTWPISSGRSGYPTITGKFSPTWMSKMHYSRKYDDAPMPHSVFFHGGFAIHATYATGMLGRPASHGCVRLSPSNAKTFYNLVSKHGKAQTRIAVFGSPKYSAPRVAKRKVNQPSYAGFDWGFGSSSYDSSYQKPSKKAQRSSGKPKIVYRNGKPYVYVGQQAAKKYWQKNSYSGSYSSY